VREAKDKLSRQQVSFLLQLAALQRRTGDAVDIKDMASGKKLSHAQVAARSRMIRALERRGLVARLNRTSDDAAPGTRVRRASMVLLTPLGRCATKVLTNRRTG
jgi:hypothetical protein